MMKIVITTLMLSFITLALKAQIYCPPNNNGATCTSPNDTHQSDFNVQTPNLSNVAAFYWYSFSSYSCNVIANFNEVMQSYPNAVLLDCPDPTYNCHGYAWRMQFSVQR